MYSLVLLISAGVMGGIDGLALNAYGRETFYGGNAKGDTDYPFVDDLIAPA